MKTRSILLMTIVGLLIGAPSALAAPSVDTLLVAGYDAEEMRLVYSTSDVYDEDSTREANNTNSLDCSLVGDFEYELDGDDTDDTDGTRVGELTSLTENAPDDVDDAEADDRSDTFFFQEREEAEEGDDDYLAPAEYGTEEAEECDLTAYSVRTTADGEVNHGMVVSTFVHTLKDAGVKGAGCLIRHVAQSDWGKEDGVVANGDDPTTVTLESFATACNLAKKDRDDAAGGPPPWAGIGKKAWEAQQTGETSDAGGPPPWAGKKGGPSSDD